MDKNCQEQCFKLLKKYKNVSKEYYKIKYRNELYILMKDYLLIWMQSTLTKWKKYSDETELLSNSWDAFIFCIDSYDTKKFNTHIPYFFSKYINYWLLMHYAKKDEGVHIPLEDLEDTLKTIEDPHNIAFGKLLRLYRMRDSIPEESKVVWDDAFLSLSNSNSDRENYKSTDIQMPQKVYYTMKKSFKGIIRFILEE